MQKEERKFCDSTVFEGMTSIRAIIKSIDNGTNDRKIEKILFSKDKISKISKEIGYFKAVSSKYGFELIESSDEELESITLGTSHGGIVAITGARTIPEISPDTKILDKGFYAMIQGIEDPYNFGYALRSLYAVGADGIILPPRNWMSAAGVVCRSSAGASELFEMYQADPVEAVKLFKSHGYKIVCAEENTDNILGECSLPLPILLIVGGEKRGISRAVLDLADILVKIDYGREFKASLSAASATTMFAYEIMRQNR
ncbi:MAG: RNA methyltransferase [Ruminococcaceae bacterium]|nr:RNA methyltransferase [Oscillospiraceae bacterium]